MAKTDFRELARRVNFFTASFVGVLGIAMATEIFREDDPADKIDDILMVVLAGAAIYWYKKTGYKLNKSLASIIFIAAAILIKLLAVYIEHADAEAVGDDFGVLAILIVALVFVVWQTLIRKK